MKHLILMQGCPGSGKSTIAKCIASSKEGVIRSTDDRFIGDDGVYKWNQDLLGDAHRKNQQLVLEDMVNGVETIIVDNTNVLKKHVQPYLDMAKEYGYEVQIVRVDREYATCANQNQHNVPARRIKDMKKHMQSLIHDEVFVPTKPEEVPIPKVTNKDLPSCIICDIDGTVAFLNGRDPFDPTQCVNDIVNTSLVNILNSISSEFDAHIFFVTGRDYKYYEITDMWINENVIRKDLENYTILMRKEGDNRHDYIIKEEAYHKYIEGKYNVLAVFEDRDRNVYMYRKLGLPTYQPNYGGY